MHGIACRQEYAVDIVKTVTLVDRACQCMLHRNERLISASMPWATVARLFWIPAGGPVAAVATAI